MRAVVGLVALNGVILLLGAGLLLALRVRAGPGRPAAAGSAYLLGVSLVILVGTVEIVVGVPVGPATLLLGCLVAIAAVRLVGALGVPSQADPEPGPASRSWPASLRGRTAVSAVALGFVALAVYAAALFRAARVMPAHEWDGWWVWTIRAKSLLFDGRLGGEDLVLGSVYPSYPPGLSVLYATALEAMGSVDTVTLHLQNWFLAAGFAAALAGLLVHRVRAWIAVPAILLVLTLPALREQALLFHADALLAYVVAIAALLLLAWLETRAPWLAVAGAFLLAGALLTKRDGLLFVACVLAALFAASWWQRRWAWPRLAAASLAVGAAGSIWWIARPRLGETAPSGGLGALVDDPARFAGAVRLTLETAFDSTFSSFVALLVVLAVALAAAVGAWRLVSFASVFMALSFVGIAAAIAAEPAFELSREPVASPVDRLVLVPLVVLGSILALLLEAAWRGSRFAGSLEVLDPAPSTVLAYDHGIAVAARALPLAAHRGAGGDGHAPA